MARSPIAGKKVRSGAYKFTAGRAQSLAKARAVSARNRSIRAQQLRGAAKAIGDSKGKFKPSIRFTRHSQSIKIEGRTRVIPGTGRRFAGSANLRFEKISKQTLTDRAIPVTRIHGGKIKSTLGQYSKEGKIPTGRRGGRSSAV